MALLGTAGIPNKRTKKPQIAPLSAARQINERYNSVRVPLGHSALAVDSCNVRDGSFNITHEIYHDCNQLAN
jgi:hypothetical protein